jgi:hypothetical protein
MSDVAFMQVAAALTLAPGDRLWCARPREAASPLAELLAPGRERDGRRLDVAPARAAELSRASPVLGTRCRGV